MKKNALLALEDGTIFYGESIGASGKFLGEAVFNTAMTGYQEILTDPSYAGQIIVFTTPHIGNVGINFEDQESEKIWAGGVIMRSYSSYVSNWRSQATLKDMLVHQDKIGISGIDTRALAHHIREKGTQKCFVTAGETDAHFAVDLPLLKAKSATSGRFHVAVMDFGVKRSILQKLEEAGCRVTQVTPACSFDEIMSLNVDGVVLSNGPGDPADYDLGTIKRLVESAVPQFGICLGHQLLARACGAKTVKMRAGHHGTNHPIVDIETKRVLISSQNHNYVVDENSLPSCLKVTHRSLFDGTIAGIRRIDRPVFGFQGHPEASGGPHDFNFLFDNFVKMICQSVLT